MTEHLNPNSFNQAYSILKRNADTLQRAKEPDIDALVPLVEESMAAFKICKSRIEAVRQTITAQIGATLPED